MDGIVQSGIPIQFHQNCLVAAIQVDLDKSQMKLFKNDLLHRISGQKNLKGVILDLSARSIIDLVEYNEFRKLIDIIRLMGFETVILGLKPAVISSLIMMQANIDGIKGAMGLDEAIDHFEG